MICNIIFDLGNVLLFYNEDEIVSHFTDSSDEKKFIHDEVVDSPEWFKLDEGNISIDDAIKSINDRTNNKYSNLVNKFMHEWYKYQFLNNKTDDILKYLKYKGYKIYILSNLSKHIYNHFKNLDLFKYVDGEVISYQEHIIKPDENIYKILLNKYNLNPNECLFIDDRLPNIESANKLNIKGRKVNPDDSSDVIKVLNEYLVNA